MWTYRNSGCAKSINVSIRFKRERLCERSEAISWDCFAVRSERRAPRNGNPLFTITVGFCLILLFTPLAFAEDLKLQDLIDEALKNNPEILAHQARCEASEYRIPQARSLPDPMFMFGYQNEGFDQFTIGKEPNAQGMFSLSQMFFFPGKRSLKGEMAKRDAESSEAMANATKLQVLAKVKESYYDLFLAHKNIEILDERTSLFSRIEGAALARYSAGMAPQQEVIMAQTEKYMLLEKEEMQRQKIQALEGMLNTTLGRDVNLALGKPAEPPYTTYPMDMDELLKMVSEKSPEILSKEKMIEAADAKIRMAKKEYYPDFTINAGYFPRTRGLLDMWSLTTTINLPLYYKTKQQQAVLEADASRAQAQRELISTQYMLSSGIRENYSMLTTSEKLMTLYKDGLIPKTYQDFELALAGYVTGKVEAVTAITRLKALLDFELLYWGQRMEREKAIARLEAITGIMNPPSGHNEQ